MWWSEWRDWRGVLAMAGYFCGVFVFVMVWFSRGRSFVVDWWWLAIVLSVLGSHLYAVHDKALSVANSRPSDTFAYRVSEAAGMVGIVAYLAVAMGFILSSR